MIMYVYANMYIPENVYIYIHMYVHVRIFENNAMCVNIYIHDICKQISCTQINM